MLAAFTDARVAARSVLNRGRAAGERVPVVPVPPMPAFDPEPLRRAAQAVIATPGMSALRVQVATTTLAAVDAEDYNGVAKLTHAFSAAVKDVCEAYNVLALEAKQVLINRALHPHLEAFAAYVECLAEHIRAAEAGARRGRLRGSAAAGARRAALRPGGAGGVPVPAPVCGRGPGCEPAAGRPDRAPGGGRRAGAAGGRRAAVDLPLPLGRRHLLPQGARPGARVPAARELPQPGGGARAAERVVCGDPRVASSRCGWRSIPSRRRCRQSSW